VTQQLSADFFPQISGHPGNAATLAALVGQIAYDVADHPGAIQGVEMQTGGAKHPQGFA